MKKIKVNKIVLIIKCPICKNEIKGSTKGQNKYNLRLHLEAHKKKGEIENHG